MKFDKNTRTYSAVTIITDQKAEEGDQNQEEVSHSLDW